MSPAILFVTTTLDVGGAEVMLVELARDYVARGARVGVVSLAGEGAYGAALWQIGVTVYSAIPRSRALLHVVGAIRKFQPDVVHGWMYHGNVAASLARWVAASPAALVWTIHQSLYELRREKPLTRLLIRAGRVLSTRASAITYVSGTSLEQHAALGYSNDMTLVVPNGFAQPNARDVANWRRRHRDQIGARDTDFVIGQIARFHPMKNHLGMVDIAARLIQRHADTLVVLVGHGVDSDNSALRARIADHGIDERVRLLGRRSDASHLVAAIDVLCVPSLWGEAFPMVMGEAMSAGVVCVTNDVGDARVLVEDIGTVVPSGDEAAFVDALFRLAQRSDAQRNRDAECARASIERRFAMQTIAERYLRLYDHVRNETKKKGAG